MYHFGVNENRVQELVDYMGFDEEHKKTILAEITRYNTFCTNGEDEDCARDLKMLLPVDQSLTLGMAMTLGREFGKELTQN